MKKAIIIILGLAVFVGIFIFSMDWGTVVSEIEKSKLEVDDVQIRERTTFTDLNGLSVGKHIASTIAKDKSELLFNIEGLKKTTGRFDDVLIELDVKENVDKSELKVKIKSSSIFTNNSTRDDALISDEYFNSTKYPFIEYQSSNIERGDSSLVTNGILSFMGKEKELSFPMTILGEGMNDEGVIITAFEGRFDFDRTEYGMLEEKGIGNIVHISFYCELILTDN